MTGSPDRLLGSRLSVEGTERREPLVGFLHPRGKRYEPMGEARREPLDIQG